MMIVVDIGSRAEGKISERYKPEIVPTTSKGLQEMNHELRRVGGSNQLSYTVCCYCLCRVFSLVLWRALAMMAQWMPG